MRTVNDVRVPDVVVGVRHVTFRVIPHVAHFLNLLAR